MLIIVFVAVVIIHIFYTGNDKNKSSFMSGTSSCETLACNCLRISDFGTVSFTRTHLLTYLLTYLWS
jgi:hypothetical protein